jgi:hypothetical protein
MAEEKRRNRQGFYEWVQVRPTNHLLDCTVIAFALDEAYNFLFWNAEAERVTGFPLVPTIAAFLLKMQDLGKYLRPAVVVGTGEHARRVHCE